MWRRWFWRPCCHLWVERNVVHTHRMVDRHLECGNLRWSLLFLKFCCEKNISEWILNVHGVAPPHSPQNLRAAQAHQEKESKSHMQLSSLPLLPSLIYPVKMEDRTLGGDGHEPKQSISVMVLMRSAILQAHHDLRTNEITENVWDPGLKKLESIFGFIKPTVQRTSVISTKN